MKRGLHERASAIVLVIATAAVVVVLAVLQYRWSNQLSEATAVRLADSLQMSMINWHLNFFRDLSELCLTERAGGSTPSDPDAYVRRFHEWRSTAPYPDLISALYILQSSDTGQQAALALRPSDARFEKVDWPRQFEWLPRALRADSSPRTTGADRLADVDKGEHITPFAARIYATGVGLADWRFEPEIPALLHPLREPSAPLGLPSSLERGRSAWLLIELDVGVLRSRLLPDLAKRYFTGADGLDYQVALVAGTSPRRVIYSSDPHFGDEEVTDPDGKMNLFGRPLDKVRNSPTYVFHKLSEDTGPATSLGTSWFPLLRETPPAADWQLVVRHRRGGPLGAFVGDMHRRDLTISFGALLLLVIAMTMWIVVGNRAQRLARLQMDFVTAVSHELRTPLSVISSAADNIAHGVVHGQQQLTQYGSVIGAQAKKLSALVEEVLLFASIREARQRYRVLRVDVSELIDSALAASSELIQSSGFTVERDIQPNVPPVTGDPAALSQCLQNLITNALKYGSSQRWLGIRARVSDLEGPDGKEAQISVSDRGMGIDAADLPHIFDPFYRSHAVAAAQIHGTGLGLSLAKSIAEAMNGRVTVVSTPGRGSTFTVHLPCTAQAAEAARV